ncbi:hypothetical protein Taro_041957 [Colocasia esculenta]|uniref:Aminotransferase-like plant mobile domain-containing protein n=1 Tax=Colocasia esculenta TaxID=4460 RepID=A0A843WXA2_COLES|nr:hypothetical protein [Colocasia esculenta]
MEGGGEGGQGSEGSGRRCKKSIRRRQPGEGTSTASPEVPPAVPMDEEPVVVPGDEDEPVGPKKSELRSRLGWVVIRAIYDGLPDIQVRRLESMGFGPFLRLEELAPDVALIQALKERWDPECHAFLFPWGHMVPTLEDVVWITGLRVDGQAVTGTTYTSYQELVERLLELEVRGERSSLVGRTALQASLGVASARHRTGEEQAEYLARLTEDARAVLAEEEGEAADSDLRRFLILVIGKLILAAAAARAEDALAQLREREQELRTALARTTALEAEMAELRLRPEAAEATRWRQEAEAAVRWQQEAVRLRDEAGDLRTQLVEERHCGDMLRSEMRGLERALALVGRSRSAASRSGIPSGSAGHYLTGSSGRRRNEEEERRRT